METKKKKSYWQLRQKKKIRLEQKKVLAAMLDSTKSGG
jgi:hypothetical protein